MPPDLRKLTYISVRASAKHGEGSPYRFTDDSRERYQESLDSDRGISESQKALKQVRKGDPARLPLLRDLITRLGSNPASRKDLDDAISYGEEALRLISKKDPLLLQYSTQLGDLYYARFTRYISSGVEELDARALWVRLGDFKVDNAISLERTALKQSAKADTDTAKHSARLSHYLAYRSRLQKSKADLNEAITHGRNSLNLTVRDDPQRPAMLNSLSNLYHTRFVEAKAPADLDQCISLKREAFQYTNKDEKTYVSYATTLSDLVASRFDITKSMDDLDDAITYGFEGINSSPDDSPQLPPLWDKISNLCYLRYTKKGNQVDLDKSISLVRKCVQHTLKDDPAYVSYSRNLSEYLASRFRLGTTESTADLDDAILYGREFLDLSPLDDPQRSHYLHNIAELYYARFLKVRRAVDSRMAVSLGREAMRLTPESSLSHSIYTNRLSIYSGGSRA